MAAAGVKHKYAWKKVVIGGTLDALIQAHKTNSHLIINNVDGISPFDEIGDDQDLGIKEHSSRTLYELWENLSYELAMKGLNPFGLQVDSVKLEDNTIEVMANSRKTIIQAEEICVYSIENVSGLEEERDEITGYRVLDWFDVRKGMNHDFEYYEREEKFCNKFYFYLSERIDGNKKFKDLVVESFLSVPQIKDPDFSDTMVRLISTRVMKELNIHPNAILETRKRQLIPIRKKIYYELSFSGNNPG